MGLKENARIFFRQLWGDTAARWFLVLFVLTYLPYAAFGAASDFSDAYGYFVASVFLFPFTVYVLWPRRPGDYSSRELLFWRCLSLIFTCWWAVSVMYLFSSWWTWNSYFDIVTDALFLVYYVGWLAAAGMMPHVTGNQVSRRPDRWFRVTAPIVLVFGMLFYFVLIPLRLAPDVYDSYVPSLLFYTVVDVVLVLIFVALTVRAWTTRWRFLYAMLASVHILYAILDLLEALRYTWVYGWASSAVSDTLWTLPFLLLVVIARARGYEFADAGESEKAGYSARDILETSISPVIMVSFVLPVAHIALDKFGMLDEATRGPQATVVLCSLAAFWALALWENTTLRLATAKSRVQQAELEELRVQQAVTEKSELAKARFLANVSHEIRTPMNGILGMSDILLQGKLDGEQKRHAAVLKTSAQELVKVVDDILVYSRMEAGEHRLVMAPFRLDELATEVLNLFGATEESDQVVMELEIQDGVPLGLDGDVSRLRQVLVNLVANALKFTSQGQIRLSVSVRERTESNALVVFEVSDSGIGISPEKVAHLFQPFSQGDESTSRKYGGTGLGLAISKRIVEQHGGRIGVRPNPEGGSVFWFEIPFTLSTVEDVSWFEPDPEPAREPSGRKILLAEDDEINLLVATKQLELLGHAVDVARDGEEAVKAVDSNTYSLVLMDCQMPALDGLEATRLIREKGLRQAELPIIALTANAFEGDREACLAVGMNDFIAKPVTLDSLRKVLDKWL